MLNTITSIHGPAFTQPIVTGGTFYTSGGYNYRVFTGNGTLGITGGSVTFDILVIGGGGSGQSRYGGSGGGAGGCRYSTAQTLTAGSYAVTVGAGGAAKAYAGAGNAGTNSLCF